MPDADPITVLGRLEGLAYPATPEEIVGQARARGASAAELTTLEGLSRPSYESAEEVATDLEDRERPGKANPRGGGS